MVSTKFLSGLGAGKGILFKGIGIAGAVIILAYVFRKTNLGTNIIEGVRSAGFTVGSAVGAFPTAVEKGALKEGGGLFEEARFASINITRFVDGCPYLTDAEKDFIRGGGKAEDLSSSIECDIKNGRTPKGNMTRPQDSTPGYTDPNPTTNNPPITTRRPTPESAKFAVNLTQQQLVQKIKDAGFSTTGTIKSVSFGANQQVTQVTRTVPIIADKGARQASFDKAQANARARKVQRDRARIG